MTVTDEELMAYVDGELDAARSESLRQQIAASADLTRRVADQQALRDRLRHAFDRTLTEPVPSRLTDLALNERVIDFALATRKRPSRTAWLSGLALAAGVVLGIALGPELLQLARDEPDVVASGAGIAAGGALDGALSRRLASEQSASDPIRLGVSFIAHSGEYCRTFTAQHGNDALAGLACRQGATWRIDVLQSVPIARGDAAGYRQAATSLPPLVLQAAEASMVGDALDARGEAEARDRLWRSPATTR
jgi:anti-sigma factor RsiW